jgi:hypothetical protein
MTWQNLVPFGHDCGLVLILTTGYDSKTSFKSNIRPPQGQFMGLINAKVILKNPRKPEVQPVEAEALADSGPVFLCIPQHVQIQRAIVLGDQVLFGAIAMEDMDLIIIPRTRTFDVNPLSPNYASGIVK